MGDSFDTLRVRNLTSRRQVGRRSKAGASELGFGMSLNFSQATQKYVGYINDVDPWLG